MKQDQVYVLILLDPFKKLSTTIFSALTDTELCTWLLTPILITWHLHFYVSTSHLLLMFTYFAKKIISLLESMHALIRIFRSPTCPVLFPAHGLCSSWNFFFLSACSNIQCWPWKTRRANSMRNGISLKRNWNMVWLDLWPLDLCSSPPPWLDFQWSSILRESVPEMNSLMHSKINEIMNMAYVFSIMQILINQSIIGRLFAFLKTMLN